MPLNTFQLTWCKTFTFQDVWMAVMNYMAAHITVAVSNNHKLLYLSGSIHLYDQLQHKYLLL